MTQQKYYHKFDKITDICIRCGIKRRNVSIVGSGYNSGLKDRFSHEYSTDGIKWNSNYINCIH